MARRPSVLPMLAAVVATAGMLAVAPPAHAVTAHTGGVTGRATANGTGVAGVVVTARTPANRILASTSTDADGNYSLAGVPTGLRSICFDGMAVQTTASPLGYAYQCYNGADTAAAARPVSVTADHTRAGINAALSQQAVIAGIVRDPDGSPVAGVTVKLFNAGGGPESVTAADGSYRLVYGTANPTYFGTYAYPGDIVTGAAPYGFVDTDGARVLLTPGQVTTAPPTVLRAAAAVAGHVTDRDSTPLPGVRVIAYDGFWSEATSTVTAADGSYRLTGLAPDEDVEIGFDAADVTSAHGRFGFLSQCWQRHNVSDPRACSDTDRGYSTVVHPVGATLTDDIDASLWSGGTVSGVVRDSAGRPIEGVTVSVTPTGATYGAYAVTATDGSWRITGLAAGQYSVCSPGRSEPAPPPYDAACLGGGTDPGSSTPVVVRLGRSTTSPDLTLRGPGTPKGSGAIAGRFVDSAGRPVSGLRVEWSTTTIEQYRSGIVDTLPDGRFRIDDIPVDAYEICVEADQYTTPGDEGQGLAPICLPSPRVASRTTTDLGTVTVPEAGRVTGRITDAAGYELYGWIVYLRNLDTGILSVHNDGRTTGTFTSDPLVAGRYSVCVSGGYRIADSSRPPRGFAEQCWRAQIPATPTPVTVTSGVLTGGIDFRMRPQLG